MSTSAVFNLRFQPDRASPADGSEGRRGLEAQGRGIGLQPRGGQSGYWDLDRLGSQKKELGLTVYEEPPKSESKNCGIRSASRVRIEKSGTYDKHIKLYENPRKKRLELKRRFPP